MSAAESTWSREESPSVKDSDAEALLERFERDWEHGKPPALEDVLRDVAAGTRRQWLLQELVKIDLEYRWRERRARRVEVLATVAPEAASRADGPRLEEYLRRFPELSSGAALVGLLGEEYRARRLGGDYPAIDEYRGRFPVLSTALAELLPHINAEIAAEGSTAMVAPDDFEVLEELGRGGMGVVFKARQRSLGRLVALKVLSLRGPAEARELDRFRTEAHLAADLVHPNIVTVHEVGESGGRPYLCLEYIAGGTLADRLAIASLPPNDAATLLETVARAVHHAHLRGIVHRDLKPANVLLSEDGTPKVADFGLAKQIDRDSGHTQSGAVLGTPCYMAPEQAAGNARGVGPAADLHALGAILYECLTGRPPFKGTTILETLDQVKNDEPLPPRRLRPGLPRDLETICLKCLEKAPAARYGSALDLAEDLRRFRAGEPIHARRVGPAVRLIKWARRRPTVAALSALCIAASLALLLGGWWYNLRLQAALARSQRNQERAERNLDQAFVAVDRMLTQVAEELFKVPEMDEVRKQLLGDAVAVCEEILKGEDDAGPRARREVGGARWRLGKIDTLLGESADALEHYRQARSIQTDLVGCFPEEPAYREDLARTCLDEGQLLSVLGRKTEAETRVRQAIGVWESLVPPTAASRAQLATCYLVLGGIVDAVGRTAEADDLLARAVQVRAQLARDHPDDRGHAHNLGLAQYCLGNQHATKGHTAKAAEAYQAAVNIFERLDRLAPDRPDYQDALAGASMNLAQMIGQDRPKEAQTRLRQAVAVRERLVRDHPRVIGHHTKLATNLYALARRCQAEHLAEEGLAVLQRCVQVREEALRRVPGDVALRTELAETYGLLGMHCAGMKREKESEKGLSAAVKLLEELTREHPEMVRPALSLSCTCNNRGMTLRWLGKPAAAMPWHDRAVTELEARMAKGPPDAGVKGATLSARAERAATRGVLHRYAEAIADLDRAIELMAGGPDGDWLRLQRAWALARVGDHRGALAEVDRLAGKPGVGADLLYDVACIASLAADAAGRDEKLSSQQRQADVEHCGHRAVELLRMVEAKGGFATFGQKCYLMTDDLRPLRQREDYRRFFYHLWLPH